MTDYTEIRDDEVRTKICDLMSAMLDNPDEHGIYPTSEFMWKMESYVMEFQAEVERLEKDRNQAREWCRTLFWWAEELGYDWPGCDAAYYRRQMPWLEEE